MITETATSAPGLERAAAEHQGRAGDDAEAQRVLDGAVRQVPRGAAVADLAGRPVRRLAVRRRRVRDTSTASSAARTTSTTRRCTTGTSPVEPEKTPEEGYHLTEDLTDQAIDWIRTQKALAPGQAVLRVLRARRDPRPAPRAAGVGGQVRRPVRRRLGRPARVDLRAAEAARRRARGRRADRRGRTRSRPGTRWTTRSSRCWSGRWRSTPGSSSTPTSTSAG